MKKVLMILVVVMLASVTLSAQKMTKEEKKAAKKERKEAKKLENEQEAKTYELLKAEALGNIDKRDFVLMADQISGKNNRPVFVTNNFNFVKIEGDKITIQFALNGYKGQNDMGGITYRGNIKKVESNDYGKGKPGNVMIEFVSPDLRGIASVNISIMGERAKATLAEGGDVINFNGIYMTVAESLLASGRSRGGE